MLMNKILAAIAVIVAAVTVLATSALPATTASAATASLTLNLKILLIGNGSADVTTAAWEAALKSEGVAYDEVTASGTSPSRGRHAAGAVQRQHGEL